MTDVKQELEKRVGSSIQAVKLTKSMTMVDTVMVLELEIRPLSGIKTQLHILIKNTLRQKNFPDSLAAGLAGPRRFVTPVIMTNFILPPSKKPRNKLTLRNYY